MVKIKTITVYYCCGCDASSEDKEVIEKHEETCADLILKKKLEIERTTKIE